MAFEQPSQMPGCTVAVKARGDDTVSLWTLAKTWWPFLLGHVIEWYDFAVYGYLAHAMQENFFDGSALATWFGFSVTFLARPLGGMALGRMADVLGRRRATLVSITGMLVATVGQGLLPSYRCCGPAAGAAGLYALLVLRLLQGLFAGGELPAIVAYFTETAPRGPLAFATSLSTAAAVMAFLVADGFAALLVQALGDEQMVQWGWRIPYLVPLLPGLISLWGRARLPETEEFLSEQRRMVDLAGGGAPEAVKPRSTCLAATGAQLGAVREFVSEYGWNALVGIGGVIGFATTFYVGLVWCPSHLRNEGMDTATSCWVGVAGNLVMIATLLVFAAIGDVVGIAYVKLIGAVYAAVLGFPLFYIVNSMPQSSVAGFLCVSLGFGSAAGIQASVVYLFAAELFPTSQRALGFAMSFNVALGSFGGAGGLVAQATLKLGSAGPGVWISAVSLVSAAILALGFSFHRRGVLKLAHLRPEPYFGKVAARQPKVDATSHPQKPTAGTGEAPVDEAEMSAGTVEV